MKSEHIAVTVNIVLFAVIFWNFHAIVDTMAIASETVYIWYSKGYLHPAVLHSHVVVFWKDFVAFCYDVMTNGFIGGAMSHGK